MLPVAQVSNAWKHMRAVVREDEKPTDLYDLLQNSARDASVSPQIAGVRPDRMMLPQVMHDAQVYMHQASSGSWTGQITARCYVDLVVPKFHGIGRALCGAVAISHGSAKRQPDRLAGHGARALRSLPDSGFSLFLCREPHTIE